MAKTESTENLSLAEKREALLAQQKEILAQMTAAKQLLAGLAESEAELDQAVRDESANHIGSVIAGDAFNLAEGTYTIRVSYVEEDLPGLDDEKKAKLIADGKVVSQIVRKVETAAGKVAPKRAKSGSGNRPAPGTKMQRYLDLYNDGHSVREIAAMHSVNTSTIWKMLKMHPDYVARSE